ncbi:hypothetical protein LSH36_26g12017 [Paralvinella palmiformis]|uniref:Uncharacterized protein n=1 Tax=Paralvinella palmiformis TaxID=53620 RepID=A0AAD9KBW0_9ANNE|nr:hypothetical protein LSH36_26g12017 [Paralvinella palmiformis]
MSRLNVGLINSVTRAYPIVWDSYSLKKDIIFRVRKVSYLSSLWVNNTARKERSEYILELNFQISRSGREGLESANQHLPQMRDDNERRLMRLLIQENVTSLNILNSRSPAVHLGATATPLLARPDPETSPTADRPVEVFLEAVVHEAVDDRIRAAVAVAAELEEGHGQPLAGVVRRVLVEQRVDVPGEEREPGQREQEHDQGEHAHYPLLFLEPAARVTCRVGRLSYWLPPPEPVDDAAVGGEQDGDREQVEQEIEVERVDDIPVRSGEVFHASGGHAELAIFVDDQELVDLLDEKLWQYHQESGDPEDQDQYPGTLYRVYVAGSQWMADGVIPGRSKTRLDYNNDYDYGNDAHEIGDDDEAVGSDNYIDYDDDG